MNIFIKLLLFTLVTACLPQSKVDILIDKKINVSINQAITEVVGGCNFLASPDPTSTVGFSYRVEFSRAIRATSFTSADISNDGTGGSTSLIWSITNCGDDKNFMLTTTAIDGNGTIIPKVAANKVSDAKGVRNKASTSTDNSVTFVSLFPSVVINQATLSTIGSCNFTNVNDPTSSANFSYRVQFSKAIDPLTFTVSDITNTGTGGSTSLSWSITNCGDDTNFMLTAITITGDGTIIPSLAANLVQDPDGNNNTASTSTDNSVTYDSASPAVTVNQSITETVGTCNFNNASDPTSIVGFSFRVQFSEVINPSSFTTSDIVNNGTGGATTLNWVINNCGDNRNFMITASAIVGNGTIIPVLNAGVIFDLAGNGNLLSSATDNSVTYDTVIPSVTINQAITETVGTCNFTNVNDPTSSVGFGYKVQFSKPINASTFSTSDITNAGTGGATSLTWSLANCGDDTNFMLTATAITGNGTIIPNIASSAVQDASGNNNSASTSTDNSVTYDTISPTVTINQAINETVGACSFAVVNDPVSSVGFSYRVQFSESINTSTLSTSDISNAGTGGATTLTWSLMNCGDDRNFMLTATAVTGNGTIIPNIAANAVQDASGNNNTASTSTDNSVTYDTVSPTVSINQEVSETIGTCTFTNANDPTSSVGFSYRVEFSEAINGASFTVSDITNAGTGGATSLIWSLANCGDDTNFMLTASTVVGDGTIVPVLNSGTIFDRAGNGNLLSSATDNSISYDSTAPSVTINQAVTETVGTCSFSAPTDPTSVLGFGFRIQFSEGINSSTFTTSDITNNGTGGTTTLTWVLANCGDNRNFMLTASDVTGDGTIIPILSAAVVQDIAGNNNSLSTSTDNSVTFIKNWYQEAYIKSANSDQYDEFGVRLSLNGETLVATAPYESSNQTTITNGSSVSMDNSRTASGAVYVYKRTGSTWTQEAYIKAVNADNNDQFGWSVSLSGDTLIVGAQYEDSNQTTITHGTGGSLDNSHPTAGAVYVYKRTGTTWAQEAYIKASNNSADSYFGFDVEISNNTLIIAALGEASDQTTITNGTGAGTNNSHPWSGAIYVFKRSGVTWTQQAFIKAGNNNIYDQFGIDVSISGDTIAVGSDGEDSTLTTITNGTGTSTSNAKSNSGAVYVYRNSGNIWTQEAYIKASNSGASDWFGTGVSISGDTLAVGAPGEDSTDTVITNGATSSADNTKSASGAVYVYKRTGVTWAQEAFIKAANSGIDDAFGRSISLSGNTLVVGATNEDSDQTSITNGTSANADNSKSNSGAIYIYRRTGTNWQQEAFIKARNSDINDYFGTSISLSGDTLAVGANGEASNQTVITNGTSASADNSISWAGAIYIYRNKSRLFEVHEVRNSVSINSITLSWPKVGGTSTGYYVTYQLGSTAPANCTSGSFTNVGDIDSYTLNALNSATTYSYRVCATDGSTITSGLTGTVTTLDTAVTLNVTLEKAISETVGNCSFTAVPSPALNERFEYRVTFSSAIDPTTFSSDDITNSGTGGSSVLLWTIENCGDDRNFKLIARTIYGDGTIIPSISAGNVQTTGGSNNLVSTSVNNSVSFTKNWYQEAYIKAVNVLADADFGRSVSIDGETIAVGSRNEFSNQTTITNGDTASTNTSSGYSGAVYVYKRNGSIWAQEAYIKASNNNSSDYFGSSVSLNADTIAVGAIGEDSNETTITNGPTASADNSNGFSGAVYVYKRSGTNWVQEAYIKAANSDVSDRFGSVLSLDGDTLIVGAFQESSNQNTITNGPTASSDNSSGNSGAVYVYKRTGTNWIQEAFIKASNSQSTDQFGQTVSLSGDTIAVGAPSEDSNQTTITTTSNVDNSSSNSGAVYIYVRTGTAWALEAYIKAVNNGVNDNFGSSIFIVNNTLVVGTPDEDSNQSSITNGSTAATDNLSPGSGAVYIYERTGTTWAQQAYIKSSNVDSNDIFGYSVSLSSNTLVVGARDEDSMQTTILNGTTAAPTANLRLDSGAVYVYKRTGTIWGQEAYIKSYNSKVNDQFGSGVSISGDTIIVGAPYEASHQNTITNGELAGSNDDLYNAGAVYVYRNKSRLFELNKVQGSTTSNSVTISWTKTGGSASGYIIAYQAGATAPANCSSGTDINVGNVDTYTEGPLSSATTYSFRICATDGVLMTDGVTITLTTDP